MKDIKPIQLKDYLYDLPSERIATHGLQNRLKAKLLVCKHGQISHHQFSELPSNLPIAATLFFNDCKVIPARLYFSRKSGAVIEILLLNPTGGIDIAKALSSSVTTCWECKVGNLKKWADQELLTDTILIREENLTITAQIQNREKQSVIFSWDSPKISFSEIIQVFGHTPLPPYIKRADTREDKIRYQTIYSRNEGAVAAPTAGLHFTADLINSLAKNGFSNEFLTLYVGAGTFQPIKVENIVNHPMHAETFALTMSNVKAVIRASNIIPIGTTSLRTLESAYWFGVKLLTSSDHEFYIKKLDPYQIKDNLPSRKESFMAVLDYMNKYKLSLIHGTTEIFIFPGYKFRVIDGLLTNFHLPASTLILLVAALVGSIWRDIYHCALSNNYRFLSYGDSSLILP